MKINCIACDVEVENWDAACHKDQPQVHPIGGTLFRTYGHYGSSIFDPIDGSYIEVVVCDECLATKMSYTHGSVDKEIMLLGAKNWLKTAL